MAIKIDSNIIIGNAILQMKSCMPTAFMGIRIS